MGKHLTLDERMEIQLALKQGKPFNEIAEEVGKSRTTSSREIRKHTVTVRKGAYGRGFNECVHRFKCKATGICPDEPDCVTKNCRFCGKCNKVCEQFEKEICSKLNQPPYVCNGCENLSKCTLEKKMYEARIAEKEYRTVLVESREGFNLSDGEFENIDRIASERIKNGQSICHVLSTCKNEITCSESTLRRLVNSGALKARNIDMPRTVRFKPRKGIRRQKKIDRNCTVGRSYEDFKQFVQDNPDTPITEMDSVIGKQGGAVLLTFIFRNCNFMLAFKRDSNNAQSVIDIFNDLYRRLPENVYDSLFGVILTDNGSEFSNPSELEYDRLSLELQRTKIFYCDPSSPYQKGKVENNHELIRRIIPKGHPIDSYSQEDIDLMMSHINSYGRPQYNHVSPAQLFVNMFGEDVLHLLRQQIVSPEKIILKSSLING